MTRTTKILLAISLTTFALGFTDILWGLGKPVGAICFGLFLIFRILGRETSLYDEEQRQCLRAARAQQTCAMVDNKVDRRCLAAATAHPEGATSSV